ncbi:MAG: sigma-54 dependent transcriptional regulator [Acidobacteriota bacterium]|nr:sigma-54 dependent transcriptional regulator [Acidobacteriota bacterium]
MAAVLSKGSESARPDPRQLLLVCDAPPLLSYLHRFLAREGVRTTALNYEHAKLRVQRGLTPDLVVLHLNGNGSLGVLAELRLALPIVPIVGVFSMPDGKFAVDAHQAGATECIRLPFDLESLKETVDRFFCLTVSRRPLGEPVHETALTEDTYFVSASKRMNEIRSQGAMLAQVDLPILILGESGTGKEIVAKYIHKMSPRAHRTFLKVNCAAVPADLLESELFGYEQGAFTGASRAKPGKFEICNMGTILLDEIGEMPAVMQSKLLQVLQDGTFSRLGGRTPVKVNVRVIAATNIDIDAAIAARTFREDLYYRLNGFSIQMPPLRERKEEIPVLVEHFMRKLAPKFARQPITMSEELLDAYMQHDWPGNLRELESSVKRFLVLGSEQHVLSELSRAMSARGNAPRPVHTEAEGLNVSLKKRARSAMNEAETELIDEVLQRHNWNRRRAADELQISYKALLYKIRQYGLSPSRDANGRGGKVACL